LEAMHTLTHICTEFSLNPNDILNAYAYGSWVYGTADDLSDSDYILVHKRSMLPDGSFKQNAQTNENEDIQIINYSRAGFKNAIEYYEMSALECLFLPDKFKLQEKLKYKIDRFDIGEFVKKTIAKSSNSWYMATKHGKANIYKKRIFHAIRILDFAFQIQTTNTIDFSSAVKLKNFVDSIDDVKKLNKCRHKLTDKLKGFYEIYYCAGYKN